MAEEISQAVKNMLTIFPDADLETVSEAVAKAAGLVGENAYQLMLQQACTIFLDADETIKSSKRSSSDDPSTSRQVQDTNHKRVGVQSATYNSTSKLQTYPKIKSKHTRKDKNGKSVCATNSKTHGQHNLLTASTGTGGITMCHMSQNSDNNSSSESRAQAQPSNDKCPKKDNLKDSGSLNTSSAGCNVFDDVDSDWDSFIQTLALPPMEETAEQGNTPKTFSSSRLSKDWNENIERNNNPSSSFTLTKDIDSRTASSFTLTKRDNKVSTSTTLTNAAASIQDIMPGISLVASSTSHLKRFSETQPCCTPEKQIKTEPSMLSIHSEVCGGVQSEGCRVTPEISKALPYTSPGVSCGDMNFDSSMNKDASAFIVACDECGQMVPLSKTTECLSNHIICENCLKEEVEQVISCEEKLQLLCPEKTCQASLTLDALTSLLDQFVLDLLKKNLKKKEEKISLLTINSMGEMISCPACSQEGLATEECLQVQCHSKTCQISFCSYCMLEWGKKNHAECEILTNVGIKCLKDISKLPGSWKDLARNSKHCHEKTDVPLNSKLGKKLIALFNMSRPAGQIRRIQRIQNRKLWEKYVLKRKHMMEDLGLSCINERVLFHGTTPEKLNYICDEGFDIRVQAANGRALGNGTYFSPNSALAQRYGPSQMFVSRVLCGRSTLGSPHFTRPPVDSSNRMVDSCSDGKKAPQMYIIFDNAQCYPEFLIKF